MAQPPRSMNRRLRLLLERITERVRDSLLYIPAGFILASLLLAWVANRLDQAVDTTDVVLLLPTSTSAARTLLGTVAGATITVSALVFSITAVAAQLAATQYSPRVLQGFLRDRFQQVVVGVVVGTFSYSLVALAVAGNMPSDPERVDASFAATFGLVLGVVSALVIVAFIDHATRRIRVDDMVRRLTSETAESMASALREHTETTSLDGWDVGAGDARRYHADHTGWVQSIRADLLLRDLPQGAVARLEVIVGDYVVVGDVVMSVWLAEGYVSDEDLARMSQRALALGEGRTIAKDPAFGLRQLVDIALRALSPGINDPATAADVVRHFVEPLRIAARSRPQPRVLRSGRGARVIVPSRRHGGDYVHLAFGEIRMAANDQPRVLLALVESIGKLLETDGEPSAASTVAAAAQAELGLVSRAVEDSGFADLDKQPILEALESIGLPAGEPGA